MLLDNRVPALATTNGEYEPEPELTRCAGHMHCTGTGSNATPGQGRWEHIVQMRASVQPRDQSLTGDTRRARDDLCPGTRGLCAFKVMQDGDMP